VLYDQPLIRKLYRLGHSHAVNIAAFWIRQHLTPDHPFVTVTYRKDGSILIKPNSLPTPNHS
jgi:hypothetical protein